MSKKDRMEYRLIDGNWSPRAVAYCTFHHGYLTPALMKVHKCRKRQCKRLRDEIEQKEGDGIAEDRGNQAVH